MTEKTQNKRNHKRKIKFEFSKKILILDYTVMLILMALVALHAFLYPNGYSSTLTTAAGVWAAFLTVSQGFYMWKAKNENMSKYGQTFFQDTVDTLCTKYGPEKAVPLIEAAANYLRSTIDGK